MYNKDNVDRVRQGDILKDLPFVIVDEASGDVFQIQYPYAIVLSQDCDLEQYTNSRRKLDGAKKNNQFLPNIILTPAFPSELLREGTHLKNMFNIVQDRISSAPFSRVQSNQDERYHSLPQCIDLQIPALIADFKLYFTLSYDVLELKCRDKYHAGINPIYREHLSQRFANYLNRIGLPKQKETTAN